jgi:hypothetical protein
MDLAGAGFNWGTQFVQWPCNGQDNERFSGVFVAEPPAIEQHRVKHSQLCVDVNQASSAENATIIQWECLNQTNQQFKTRGLHAGTFTGYAMGNLVNGSGTEITQGMFANHSSQYCGGDPASSWPFGTTIQTMNAQTGFHNGTTGAALSFSSFFLEDIGDLSCSLGNYWADLYFGRYKLAAQACSCPGSPAGTCYNGAVNQCTDAQNYGSHASTIYARN